MSRDSDALMAFRRSARKMPPTKEHRPILWENMLGTVYARNAAGVTEYFDYNYCEALAHIGAVEDVRVARNKQASGGYDYQAPRVGQLVWYGKFSLASG